MNLDIKQVSKGSKEGETWWWKEEVLESIQRTKTKTKMNSQEQLESRIKTKEVKALEKAYNELNVRLDGVEGNMKHQLV